MLRAARGDRCGGAASGRSHQRRTVENPGDGGEETVVQTTVSQHCYSGEPGAGSTRFRNAVISRFPLSRTASLVRYPSGFQVDLHRAGTPTDEGSCWIPVPSEGFSRPVAVVTVKPPGGATAFNLVVVHLKSRRPMLSTRDSNNEAIGIARSAIQRNVEAAGLRCFLDGFLPAQFKSNPAVPTFVMGDFNDTPTSVPLTNIRGSFDKVPGPASPWSKADRKRLVSCARLHLKRAAHEDKLYSYIHEESFSLIDQVLVSEHGVGRFKRMEVYNDHLLRHQQTREDTEVARQWKSCVSDHGIVVVELVRMLRAH